MKKVVSAFLFFVVGCDMADYQRRMDESSARLKIFDEENRYLGKAIEPPSLREKTAEKETSINPWGIDVFLRLPRGVASAPEEQPIGLKDLVAFKDFLLFKYAGDPSVYVAVAGLSADEEKSKEKKEKSKEVREPTHKEFRDRVKELAAEAMRTRESANLECDPKEEPATRIVSVPAGSAGGERKLTFETFQCEARPAVKDKDTLGLVFFHYYQHAETQVMIVFQFVKGREDQKMMELCVRSLALEAEAGARRREFARMRPKK